MASKSTPKKAKSKKTENVSKRYSFVNILVILGIFVVFNCFLGVVVYNCLERRIIPNSRGFCSDMTHLLHHWELRKSFFNNVGLMFQGYITLIAHTFQQLYTEFANGPGGEYAEQIKERFIEVYHKIVQHEQVANFIELFSNFSADFFNLISHITLKLWEIAFVYLKEVYQHGEVLIESAERYVHDYFRH
uniref:Uncharacterized protein n=1 Tax=Panagrolaimus sp. JU765 TaxID=591449 RepID=A0AC34QU64_9BILA